MGATYENDIVAWANEQAYLLRSGMLSAIDIEHIAIENILSDDWRLPTSNGDKPWKNT